MINQKPLAFIIQARKGSTRLPNKVIATFHESQSILDLLIEKLKSNFNYPIILATTIKEEDDELIALAQKHQIEWFRGDAVNVLDRFIKCAKQYQVKTCIRICADNPFLDVEFLKEIVQSHLSHNTDYTSFARADGTPVIKTHYGFFAEVVETLALEKAAISTNDKLYTEHVTNFVYGNPTEYKINLMPIPNYLENRALRFTIDTKEDWNVLRNIYKVVFSRKRNFTTADIFEFVKNNNKLLTNMQSQINRFTK